MSNPHPYKVIPRKTYKKDNLLIENLNSGNTVILSLQNFFPDKDTSDAYKARIQAYIRQICHNSDTFQKHYLFFDKTYTVKKKLELFLEIYLTFRENKPFKEKCAILEDKMKGWC